MSKLGNRWTLAIGASGYVFYSAALYHNSMTGKQPFLLVGAIICGATSGLFWVSEGAIIMLYSEPGRKGKLLALWQSLYQLATTMGGAINLALNVWDDSLMPSQISCFHRSQLSCTDRFDVPVKP
jgi:MFS family permease